MIWLHLNYGVGPPPLVIQNKRHFKGRCVFFLSHSMGFLPRLPIFPLFFSKWMKLPSILSLCFNMLCWLLMLSFWTLSEMHCICQISNGGFPFIRKWHMFKPFYWCLEHIVSLTESSKPSHKTSYNSVWKKPYFSILSFGRNCGIQAFSLRTNKAVIICFHLGYNCSLQTCISIC